MYPLVLGLKFALSYFTILPVHFKKSDDLSSPKVLVGMLFFLPLVGLILASIAIMIDSQGGWLWAIVGALMYMVLYGFIHTEAVCDVADALYAKHSGKDAYAIIKEPTIGAMGLFYGLAFFTLKIAAIVSLFLEEKYLLFASVVIISRLGLLVLIRLLTFKSSFVNQLKAALTMPYLLGALGVFSLIGVIMIGSPFLFYLLFGIILSYIIARFIGAKLGFINGDVLGVTLESVEILLFILLGAHDVV